jgi:hypothetical protein
MSPQVKKSGQCQLRDKKHQYFCTIVSLPTNSVIVDHAVDCDFQSNGCKFKKEVIQRERNVFEYS